MKLYFKDPKLTGYHLSRLTARPADLDAMVSHLANPDISKATLRIPFPYVRRDAEDFVQFLDSEREKNGFDHTFAIRDKDSYLLGCIGCEVDVAKDKHFGELGYWLGAPYRRKGITEAAARTLLDHMKVSHEVTRVQASVFPWNAASSKLLLKCGFKFITHRPKGKVVNGQPVDIDLYELSLA